MSLIGRLVGGLGSFSAMKKSAEQWARLSYREKLMVSGLFLFVLIVFFCSFILLPGVKRLTHAIEALHSSSELNYYIISRLEGLTASDTSKRNKPSISIQDLVIQSAKSTGVEIERYEVERDDYFSVSVSRVDFSRFTKWIAFLENNGVQVASFNLSRLDPGVISCSLSVRYLSIY
ncbi:type II secretion system protein GspM [Pseudomonas oryzihabitans]|uniref:type II secretion system protein GspM n=1 Tax=Pseudomonas oryzihabitans TaxID=47885 RepID=UPI002861C7C7|nr:type II secretion system protein GspM [Pseudomonas psychrotolerans]MDR6679166.1 type II secretory pathway component PulM [Pseudomonas psychrotolerans]